MTVRKLGGEMFHEADQPMLAQGLNQLLHRYGLHDLFFSVPVGSGSPGGKPRRRVKLDQKASHETRTSARTARNALAALSALA
jgi:hypothetical protein